MNAEQYLKAAIIAKMGELNDYWPSQPVTPENVDEMYEEADQDWATQDAKSETRGGEVETGIKCEYSRHYESKAVAMKMPDGQWVGWTYWYGGGKHGEPEAIDWIEDAYLLNCVEEEKMVTVRTFTAVQDEAEA